MNIGDRVQKIRHHWNDGIGRHPSLDRVGTVVSLEKRGSQVYVTVEWPPGRLEQHHIRTLRVSPEPERQQKPVPSSSE